MNFIPPDSPLSYVVLSVIGMASGATAVVGMMTVICRAIFVPPDRWEDAAFAKRRAMNKTRLLQGDTGKRA
jgi:hypothetical protein